ncbi:HMG box domain-containing protein [Mycena kentingensis (nom. inval.)]|nr:HMG box domain-containing protein [Mycena kentingensis (nom. inval.)]
MHAYNSPSDDEFIHKVEDDGEHPFLVVVYNSELTLAATEQDQALTSQTLNADGTPKRPMNAFMIFARRRRPQVSAENQSMRTGDISKILSQEWKSMPASEKQFYQNQAKLLKDTFNAKYPDYVYKRRPNNTRRKRKVDPGAMPMRGDRDTDDAESSPDAEDTPLPEHRGYYGNGSYGSGSSYSHHPYNGYSGNTHAHHRSTSYPYPQADAYRSSSGSFDSSASSIPRLLNTPYYPPPPANGTSHYGDASGSPHLGLRKAQSIPSMPLPGPNGWSAPSGGSSTSSSNGASSYPSYPSFGAPSTNGTSSTTNYSAPSHSPNARYAPLPDSPGARYSPFAGNSSTSSTGSPAPTTSGTGFTSASTSTSTSSYATGTSGGSPGHSFASIGGVSNSTPRSMVSGLGVGGLGASGTGNGGATDSYFWRSNTATEKLL